MTNYNLIIRDNLREEYSDVYTPEALAALSSLAHFNQDIKAAMADRNQRRAERQQQNRKITFLEPGKHYPPYADQGAGRPRRNV